MKHPYQSIDRDASHLKVVTTLITFVVLGVILGLGVGVCNEHADLHSMTPSSPILTSELRVTQTNVYGNESVMLGQSAPHLVYVDPASLTISNVEFNWYLTQLQQYSILQHPIYNGWNAPEGKLIFRYYTLYRFGEYRACLLPETVTTTFTYSLLSYILIRPMVKQEVHERLTRMAQHWQPTMLAVSPTPPPLMVADQLLVSNYNLTGVDPRHLRQCETENMFIERQSVEIAMLLVLAIVILIIWACCVFKS